MKIVHYGFSLIEVLIALMMLSITITSLLTLQGTLQTLIFKDSQQWKAELLALQMYSDVKKKEPLQVGKSLEHEQDGFKITYTIIKPEDGSSLAEVEGIVLQKVTVVWTRLFKEQTFTLVQCSYQPKPPEKDTQGVKV